MAAQPRVIFIAACCLIGVAACSGESDADSPEMASGDVMITDENGVPLEEADTVPAEDDDTALVQTEIETAADGPDRAAQEFPAAP